MNFRQIRELIIFIVFLVTYNVMAFAIPFSKNGAFWSAYIFAIIAIFGFGACWLYAYDKEATLRNRFLSWPIVRIGLFWYLIPQFVYSTGTMIRATFYDMPAWIVVVPSLIILSIAVVKVAIIDIAREKIKEIAVKQQIDTAFLRNLQVDMEALGERIKDEKIKTQIVCLTEKVRFSDPVSNHHLSEIETLIKSKFEEMKSMVYGGNMEIEGSIEEITLLLSERNKKCKMTKLEVNIFGDRS